MPSPNPRIQVCLEPDVYALITTLAAGRNVTRSYLVQQLVIGALKDPDIEDELLKTVDRIGLAEELPDLRQKPHQRHHYKPWDSYQVRYEDHRL